MTFTSSAALLDAIVLAVVSREKNGTMGTGLPSRSKKCLICLSQRCIRHCAGCKRMTS